jgi:hypothetical protein
MLGSDDWELVTDKQGQPFGPIFKGREASFRVKLDRKAVPQL